MHDAAKNVLEDQKGGRGDPWDDPSIYEMMDSPAGQSSVLTVAND